MAINFQEDITLIISDQGLRGIQGLRGTTGAAGEGTQTFLCPNPTYEDGLLVRIDYSSGAYKVIGRNEEGRVSTLTVTIGTRVVVNTIHYTDGVWSGTTDVVVSE
tara:strand:- start:1610 stop:1924 length:315 start_codon:yes stop_codon:yes gene_type:complete